MLKKVKKEGIYCIGYDLNRNKRVLTFEEQERREELKEKLEDTFPRNLSFLDSTWFVYTNMNAEEIYKLLEKYFDENDELVIVEILKGAEIDWNRKNKIIVKSLKRFFIGIPDSR